MAMKRLHQVLGLGAIALISATTVLMGAPVLAQLQRVGQTVAQNLQREPQIKLNLSAEKQVTTMDQKGEQVITWQDLGDQPVAHPNDILRFRLTGQNTSDRDVRNLVVIQPIPGQMQYVLNSSTVEAVGATTTYSIDGGNSFDANPTIEVTQPDGTVITRPAPAELYTHVRWDFGDQISAGTVINATYQAAVQ